MSSFNQDKLKNDLRWMEEGVFFLCLLFDGATALWFHLWGCITSGLQHGQTQLYLWMNWARGLHIFCFRKIWFFFFFFCIFHYAIYWMKLERFFSMLAPTQPQLCLRLSSKNKDWGISTSAGTSGYFIFLFVPSLLPTVMDPSSVIIRFLFFCTFTKHLVIVMQLWISAK